MQHRLGRDDFTLTNELMRGPGSQGQVWRVCQDYNLRKLSGLTGGSLHYCLVPKYPYSQEHEDKWRMYRPLEETPDLFLKFARLYRQDISIDISIELMVDWVKTYGVLGRSLTRLTRGCWSGDGWVQAQDVIDLMDSARMAAGTLALYEAVLNRDEEEAKLLMLEKSRWLGISYFREFKTRPEGWPNMPGIPDTHEMQIALISKMVEEDHNGNYLDYALRRVVEIVNMKMGSSCNPLLELGEVNHHDSSNHGSRHVMTSWGFTDLLSAMYFQMHWLVAAGRSVTRCRYCGNIISLASPLPGARKARQDKKFCDDACRQRHYYHNKTKPRRQSAYKAGLA
jgi:hypothetical protein